MTVGERLPQIFDMKSAGSRRAGLAAAVSALRSGGLVAMPTETVYGLAADATNPRAVAAVFAAKGRPRFNPLIVHVPTLAAAARLARLNPVGAALGEAFWPGPLTLVAERAGDSGIADLATAGLPTIAVRVPAHPVAQELLRGSGLPLAAPSANRSGRVSPTSAAHVVADLGDAVAVVLDAGPAAIGLESTIVGVNGEAPVLLRPGGLARERIETVLGRSLAVAPIGGAPIAPGMLPSHYAPAVPLRMNAEAVAPTESLLAFGPLLPEGAADAVAIVNLSVAGDLGEAAAGFFHALRILDACGAPIAAMPIPNTGLGEAINDRLRGAAAPRGSHRI